MHESFIQSYLQHKGQNTKFSYDQLGSVHLLQRLFNYRETEAE